MGWGGHIYLKGTVPIVCSWLSINLLRKVSFYPSFFGFDINFNIVISVEFSLNSAQCNRSDVQRLNASSLLTLKKTIRHLITDVTTVRRA